MKKARVSKNAGSYDTLYRFRCYKDLRQRAARVAKARGHGDASDVGREAVISFVEKEEKRLGLATSK
jgi:hypothetical protein